MTEEQFCNTYTAAKDVCLPSLIEPADRIVAHLLLSRFYSLLRSENAMSVTPMHPLRVNMETVRALLTRHAGVVHVRCTRDSQRVVAVGVLDHIALDRVADALVASAFVTDKQIGMVKRSLESIGQNSDDPPVESMAYENVIIAWDLFKQAYLAALPHQPEPFWYHDSTQVGQMLYASILQAAGVDDPTTLIDTFRGDNVKFGSPLPDDLAEEPQAPAEPRTVDVVLDELVAAGRLPDSPEKAKRIAELKQELEALQ